MMTFTISVQKLREKFDPLQYRHDGCCPGAASSSRTALESTPGRASSRLFRVKQTWSSRLCAKRPIEPHLVAEGNCSERGPLNPCPGTLGHIVDHEESFLETE